MKKLNIMIICLAVCLTGCNYDGGLSARVDACKAKGMIVKGAQWTGAWGWQVTCVMPETK